MCQHMNLNKTCKQNSVTCAGTYFANHDMEKSIRLRYYTACSFADQSTPMEVSNMVSL